MCLGGEIKRVNTCWKFNIFNKAPIWRGAREDHAACSDLVSESVVHLIAVAVALRCLV